tara:strand:- start:2546 stop:3673 length:1128 start_codon:yes stop_codon:yes gene_type:complete
MKVVVVIPYFYPAFIYGGPVFAAYHLSQKAAENGVNIDIITTNLNGDDKLDVVTNIFIDQCGLNVKYYNNCLLPFFSFKMIFGLSKDIKDANVVHIQSIYSLSSILALFHSNLQKKTVLLSPRGSLSLWSFKHRGLIKKIWIKFLIKPFQKRIFWHATSEKEIGDIQHFFPDANIELVSDGVDFEESDIKSECSKKWQNSFYIACLGRLHKVKGYDIMLKAMPSILKIYSNLKLFIAGSDEGELNRLKDLSIKLKIQDNIEFVGHLNSNNKNCFLKHAQCLVMPSHTENFGLVAAEALFHNTPVIASKNTPWKVLETEHAGFHIINTPQAISLAVITILKDIKFYSKNTNRVVKRFSWNNIAKTYKSTLLKISKH